MWDDKVCDTIALKGYNPEYGARPIKREIRDVVEDKISEILQKYEGSPDTEDKITKMFDELKSMGLNDSLSLFNYKSGE